MASAKERVAFGSLVASLCLAAAKFAAGFATGSLAVLSEAVHSLIDSAATAVTLWAVRAGDKPADEDHPYGHGKIESLAALGETVLLLLAAGFIAMEAVKRLWSGGGDPVEAAPIAAAVLLISIVVDFWRARLLSRTAAATGSPALEADALHFLSDMLGSTVALIGLCVVALGFPIADSVAALIVAGFIMVAGFRLGRRTVDALIDTAPAGALAMIAEAAASAPGVIAVERVRARPLGGSLFVDVTAAVDRASSVERVAVLKEGVAEAIRERVPNAEILVATLPRALDGESAAARVRAIAANEGLAVHRVGVQVLDGRLCVSLDLEVDGSLTLARAHEAASDLETRIGAEFGPETEVETHIEPLAPDGLEGRDLAEAERAAMKDVLRRLAAEDGLIMEIHHVRARETSEGVVVIFHGRAAPSLSVRNAHEAMDKIERGLRRSFPQIARVVGHAEPKPS